MPKKLLLDACVIIDYLNAEPMLFEWISLYFGQPYVVSDVYKEVHPKKTSESLGLIVLEPDEEDVKEAHALPGKPSPQDNLCYLTAKRHGFICVTNDKSLRNRCKQDQVPTLWGLELISELKHAGGIEPEDAISIAKLIKQNNPEWYPPKIIQNFENKLT